jgi:hypothetical protein
MLGPEIDPAGTATQGLTRDDPLACEPRAGDPVVVELDDGKTIRGKVREAGPDHVVIDRGGPGGPLYDPVVRIPRDRILSLGEPEADASGDPRWVSLGYGASDLGGRAFQVTFETARHERSSLRIVAMITGEGRPGAGARPVSVLAGVSDASPRSPGGAELAVSVGPALGWRTSGSRAALGWWLGAAAVGGEAADRSAFLTGGLMLGTELFFSPARTIGVGLQNATNLNPEVPFNAVFLTLRFHDGR